MKSGHLCLDCCTWAEVTDTEWWQCIPVHRGYLDTVDTVDTWIPWISGLHLRGLVVILNSRIEGTDLRWLDLKVVMLVYPRFTWLPRLKVLLRILRIEKKSMEMWSYWSSVLRFELRTNKLSRIVVTMLLVHKSFQHMPSSSKRWNEICWLIDFLTVRSQWVNGIVSNVPSGPCSFTPFIYSINQWLSQTVSTVPQFKICWLTCNSVPPQQWWPRSQSRGQGFHSLVWILLFLIDASQTLISEKTVQALYLWLFLGKILKLWTKISVVLMLDSSFMKMFYWVCSYF